MSYPQLGQNEFGALLNQFVTTTAAPIAALADDVLLSPNPDFEVNLNGWSGFNGTLARVNDRVKVGSWASRFTPDGLSTICGYGCSEVAATPLTYYRVSGWLQGDVSNQFVQLKADWKDASHNFIGDGSIVSTTMVTADTWNFFTGLVRSPALTAFAACAVIMVSGGIIPSSNVWWGDDLRLSAVDNTALATVSIGPHGENWDIKRTTMRASTNTDEAVGSTYRGLVGAPYLLETTFAASSGDTSDTPLFLRDGELLQAQWVGGDLDAVYTLTVNGWRTTPDGGFRTVRL